MPRTHFEGGVTRGSIPLALVCCGCLAGEFEDLPGCADDGHVSLASIHNTFVYLFDEAGEPRCADGGVRVTQGGGDQFVAPRPGTVTVTRGDGDRPTFVTDSSTRQCNLFVTRIGQAQCTNVPVIVRVDVPGCEPQEVSMTWRENVARYGPAGNYNFPVTLRCGRP